MITKEQLNKVDQFIALSKLTDDYILEIKDHILCDIETDMEAGLTFDAACENVNNKWVAFLKPKTNWFLGLTTPIMKKKLTTETIKNLIFSALTTILLMIPYFIYRKEMPENLNIIIRCFVLVIAVGSSVYLTLKFRFNKQKYFTSIYSNRLRNQSHGALSLCLIYVLAFGFLSNIDQLEQVSFNSLFYNAFMIIEDMSKKDAIGLVYYLILTISNFRLYFLHQRLINKLEIIY